MTKNHFLGLPQKKIKIIRTLTKGEKHRILTLWLCGFD
jgi:hypothetical protein